MSNIFNPKTNRWVKRDGKIGRQIAGMRDSILQQDEPEELQINDLPPELIQSMLPFLSYNDLISLRDTNRKMRDIINFYFSTDTYKQSRKQKIIEDLREEPELFIYNEDERYYLPSGFTIEDDDRSDIDIIRTATLSERGNPIYFKYAILDKLTNIERKRLILELVAHSEPYTRENGADYVSLEHSVNSSMGISYPRRSNAGYIDYLIYNSDGTLKHVFDEIPQQLKEDLYAFHRDRLTHDVDVEDDIAGSAAIFMQDL